MPEQTTEKSVDTYVEEILLTRSGWKSVSNAEMTKLDGLMPSVEAVMERLQESPTAFITAATTGKIDVRARVGSGKKRGRHEN